VATVQEGERAGTRDPRPTGNRLIFFEDRLSVPVAEQAPQSSKEQEVENRWVFGFEREDRDGFFFPSALASIQWIGSTRTLATEPQFPAGACVAQATTKHYPLQELPAGPRPVEQEYAQFGDLFGLEAQLQPLPLTALRRRVQPTNLSSFNAGETSGQRHPQLGRNEPAR